MAVDKNKVSFLLLSTAGAGQTAALESFESLGYIAVSGINPWQVLKTFQGLSQNPHKPFVLSFRVQPDSDAAAIVKDVEALRAEFPDMRVFTLDAPTPVLVERFMLSGKAHAFEASVKEGLEAAIVAEKKLFADIKELKDYSIDTSTTTAIELHHKIARVLGYPIENQELTVYLNTFGFKYGAPQDAELVFDMRFMTNPFYDESLRPLSGLDQPVKDFIFNMESARNFFEKWTAMLSAMLPMYQEQGKTRLTIAIGCTGGKHRSVCMGEALAGFLAEYHPGYKIVVNHREMIRWGQPKTCAIGDIA